MSHQPALLRESTHLLTLALRQDGVTPFVQALATPNAARQAALRWAATIHGVAPLLHQRLEAAGLIESVDQSLRAFLTQQRECNAAKMQVMLDELAAVLHAAAQVGIDVLPLKGVPLATHYYDASELRPMADLDLLVHPIDEQGMLGILRRLGYAEQEKTDRHHVLALPEHSGPVVDFDGEHPDNPHGLELHTRLAESFWGISYDLTDGIVDASDAARFAGAPGLLMRPLPLLEHLLIHATADIMAGKLRLIKLYDLLLVGARLAPADWTALIDAARQRREERMLYAPLVLQERYLGGVPSDILGTLERGVTCRLRDYIAGIEPYDVSFCNRAPTALGDKLSWYRPGREQVIALRSMLIPTQAHLRARFPALASPSLLPLAYGRYALLAASWPVRRILRLRRHALMMRGKT